ncbi:MAG: hypothetical protein ACRDRM_00145 [Pseudonocardiaceae bacterium]
MWLRSQRIHSGRLRDYIHQDDDAETSRTMLDPCRVWDDEHAEFAIGLRVPGCPHMVFGPGADDKTDEFTLWLFDGAGSWASVDYEPEGTDYAVDQYGPRRLWGEVEAAYSWWDGLRRPERERFGLTVTPDRQTVWLDDPAGGHAWQPEVGK